jgi:hypothetical protein
MPEHLDGDSFQGSVFLCWREETNGGTLVQMSFALGERRAPHAPTFDQSRKYVEFEKLDDNRNANVTC